MDNSRFLFEFSFYENSSQGFLFVIANSATDAKSMAETKLMDEGFEITEILALRQEEKTIRVHDSVEPKIYEVIYP
jgi:hypothetical protein